MHLKLTRYIPAVFALAVLAGIGAMSFAGGPAKVSAANTETATVTFTKWVIGYPMLAGFVSGDVGSGSFTGEVISRDPTVAKGKARVRTIVTATHTTAELQFALDAFASVGRELGLI